MSASHPVIRPPALARLRAGLFFGRPRGATENEMDRDQKTAVVKELAEELKDAQAIFAVDYRGISVPQAAELRSGLRDADARFRVVKNRLTLRAADEAGTESLKEYLEGPTALTFVKGDAALAAKTLFRLGSEWELLDLQGRPDGWRDPRRRLVHGDRPPAGARAAQRPVRRRRRQPAHRSRPRPRLDDPGARAAARPDRRAGPRDRRDPGRGERLPTPSPSESPEETSEEEAPEGEDARPGRGRGDRRRATRHRRGAAARSTADEETSEDSDENKEEGS